MRRKTAEEVEWLRAHAEGRTCPELARMFRERFGWAPTTESLYSWLHENGFRPPGARRRLSEDEDAFLRSFIPGHTRRQVADAFNARFPQPITPGFVKRFSARTGVRSGLTAAEFRFRPGQDGWNKGMRQEDYMSPDAIERSKATRFRKGDRPWNELPIGSEFVDGDGYVYVKVRDGLRAGRFAPGRSGNWVPKQAVVYEETHGAPAPADCVLAFADGDKGNFTPENIVAVPRSVWTVINCRHLPYHDADTLRVAMATAEVMSAAYAAEKRLRKEKGDGRNDSD